ncbi:imidazolonepropionase [Oceanisphaera psychrotolerans]|uniref:Imidazolonepropionase n=1 Tax=Oceanisphaera psychrotolerans TaxID=1414654 RepID=A0A1J4QIQ2_9GAMM|nr:imidazolonepropionase [Oceanisphaera psychrotolerans]OIN13505.1 imidazolonepropionase [Oceanisphaera psychrotolerans]
MNQSSPRLWVNASLFDGLNGAAEPMAVAVKEGQIAWLKPMSELNAADQSGFECVDAKGALMTPGLVDCHTHLVFGGNRAGEFEARLEGASYEEIARAGGGIISTVRATRAASEDELFESARPRLQALMADGVTTVEIKSGYGLDVENELKMLRVARRLGRELPVRVVTTLLGAHALPPEYQSDADGYIELVCSRMIPAAAAEGLADAVDVFCENIAFSVEQCERVYAAARVHGLAIKGHTEQLSNLGGSAAAARAGALSVDHIEYLDEAGVKALAEAGTVATLLPGAFYMLRETRLPPIELLRRYRVPMALATDANPGTSPIFSLKLMLNMACTLFRLTPIEALRGVTAHGARALGLQAEVGRIAPGLQADFCLWDTTNPAELAYSVGLPRLTTRIVAGVEA